MTMPLKPKHHQIEVAGVESANNVVVKFRLCNRKRIGARTSERAARVRPPTLGGVRNSERLFLAAPNYALSAVHRGLVRQRLRTLSGKWFARCMPWLLRDAQYCFIRSETFWRSSGSINFRPRRFTVGASAASGTLLLSCSRHTIASLIIAFR